MATLTYGTVTGRFEDTTSTEVIPINGTVYFVPEVDHLLSAQTSPKTVILPTPKSATLVDGAFSVDLLGTDNPSLNPLKWHYKVSFDIKVAGVKLHKSTILMDVPSNVVTDLADAHPIADKYSVPITRGLQGEAGPQGPVGPASTDASNLTTGTLPESVMPSRLAVESLDTTFDSKGEGNTSLLAALPKLMAAVRTYNDNTKPTLRVIGNGSSVGNGATLPDPATQAPVARLFSELSPVVNRLGNLTLTKWNGSVDGSTIQQGADGHYAAAKTAAGGTPSLVVLAYGMNDGQPGQYHTGQTYPDVYTKGRKLIAQASMDGADVIIFTTPHPHTTRNPWALGGLPPTYPKAGTALPLDTFAGSVVNVKSPSGATVPASYRHLRVNESLRQLAADTGSVLLDVEKHWFDAVAQYGEDALFNTAEYAHPNLLGHQLSYWKVIDDLIRGFRTPTVQATGTPAQRSNIDRTTIGAKQLNIGSGESVVIPIPAFTAGELMIWGTSGGAWHSIYQGVVVANEAAVNVTETAKGFINPGNVIAGVTGSGASRDITVATTATGAGGQITWTYNYFNTGS